MASLLMQHGHSYSILSLLEVPNVKPQLLILCFCTSDTDGPTSDIVTVTITAEDGTVNNDVNDAVDGAVNDEEESLRDSFHTWTSEDTMQLSWVQIFIGGCLVCAFALMYLKWRARSAVLYKNVPGSKMVIGRIHMLEKKRWW